MKRLLGIITMVGTLGLAAPAMAQEWYGGGGGGYYPPQPVNEYGQLIEEERSLRHEQRVLWREQVQRICFERARLEQRRYQLLRRGYGPGTWEFAALQRRIARHERRTGNISCPVQYQPRRHYPRSYPPPVTTTPSWSVQLGFRL